MPFPGYRDAMKRAYQFKIDDEVDLNVTLEDEVFAPGTAPYGSRGPWRLDPDSPKCCPNKFRHLPEIMGKLYPDPLIGSKFVMKLTEDNFNKFVHNKNKALIMLYRSVNDTIPDHTVWSKNQLYTAAETTKRGNHGYGAIDCTKEEDLCAEIQHFKINRGVTEFPFFTVFAKEIPIASISDYKTFDAARMKEYVESLSESGSLTAI